MALVLSVFATSSAEAQFSVTDGGSAAFAHPVSVPPGVSGMTPRLALLYSDSGINGAVGHGWSIQGMSVITRCSATLATDGLKGSVVYASSDKLCLDGQRLIQTDASGAVVAFPQTNDALGLGSGYREYRTEKDTFARIRAYGLAGISPNAANGPAYFKVWTKSGQVYEHGASPNAGASPTTIAYAQGASAATIWHVARISDTLGNYIDFKYEQRLAAWGSGSIATNPIPEHDPRTRR